MSGTPCFAGTRVPVQVLIDHLEMGQLDEFYLDFPTVKKEQVTAVIALLIKIINQKHLLEEIWQA